MFKKLPVFKITPIESDLLEIAIVDEPAIEEYFLKFSAEPIKIEFNSDKQILTGPVMIPNQLIYRNDSLGERFVTYDEEGIKLAVSLFFKNGLRFNESHTDKNAPIEILESYFTAEDNTFGIPAGSWIVSAKVKDIDLWNRIKDNEFNGFSFQSLFSNKLVGIEELKFNKQDVMDLHKRLQDAINAVLFADQVPAPVVETPVVVEEAPVKEDSKEDMKALLEEFKAAIMVEVDAKLLALKEELTGSVAAVDAKVEEFSKQPLSQTVTETVQNAPADSNFSYLNGVKLK